MQSNSLEIEALSDACVSIHHPVPTRGWVCNPCAHAVLYGEPCSDARRCWEVHPPSPPPPTAMERLAGTPGQVCWQGLLSLIPEALVFVKCRWCKGWRGPGWCMSAPGTNSHSLMPPSVCGQCLWSHLSCHTEPGSRKCSRVPR